HRIQVIREGESLVNDATALVALQFAVAALVTGTFSPTYAAARFVWAAFAGIGIGLLVGLAMRWVQSHLDDPPVQITISLLTPFIAYLTAEHLHASGVLATVAAYLSRLLRSERRAHDQISSWQHIAIVGWAGMRGVVSLAAAFALPLALTNGQSFPGRDYILFVAFSVILVTLVLQGLTLPLLIQKLGVPADAETDEEERLARLEA